MPAAPGPAHELTAETPGGRGIRPAWMPLPRGRRCYEKPEINLPARAFELKRPTRVRANPFEKMNRECRLTHVIHRFDIWYLRF